MASISAPIVLISAKAGGGHWACADAVFQVLKLRHPDRHVSLIDGLKYFPPPLDQLDTAYPYLTANKTVWQIGYKLLDHPLSASSLPRIHWPLVKRSFSRLSADYPSAIFVSFYFLFNHALALSSIPYFAVVTDLTSANALWFAPSARSYFLPTSETLAAALKYGIPRPRCLVTGLPVHPLFHPARTTTSQLSARKQLGLNPRVPTLLVMAGGLGIGGLLPLVRAINQSSLQVQLLIVAGRNPTLFSRLQDIVWSRPVACWPRRQK